MNPTEVREAESYLTDEERAELLLLVQADVSAVRWRPLPGPQTMAWESKADIIGFGGSAGGGKTDLIAGFAQDETQHERALIVRREKAQTEGVIQRLEELVGYKDGFNSQKSIWRIPGGALTEFAGLDNPGDERRWQGRPHDLKAFDEVTEQRENQVRFVMGWTRTNNPALHARVLMTFNPPTTTEGRWVLEFFGPWLSPSHPLYPALPGALYYCAMLPDGRGSSVDTWLDADGKPLDGRPFVLVNGKVTYGFNPKAFTPEQIIKPKSRTFIPSRLTDNPYYMASGYMSTLQSLPEPLRSQMLYGDFNAGIEDDPWQVIPTAWVKAAQARWKPRSPRGEMLAVGVDVARGGRDNTTIATRHKNLPEGNDLWFDKPHEYPGSETPDGPKVAGLVMAELRDGAPISIDVIGVGSSPYDMLVQMGQQVIGVNVSEKAHGTDRSGRLTFFNQRSMYWWHMREALDPANDTGIALPPDPKLLKELCAPKWTVSGFTIQVEGREKIIDRIGWSPDMATAFILALNDVPKVKALQAAGSRSAVLNYDPMRATAQRDTPDTGYDPMSRM